MSDDLSFLRVRQRFDATALDEVAAAVGAELAACPARPEPGQRIAIAAGSRGIAEIATILRRVVDWVRGCGAEPLIVPAMGSHGGATADGQAEALAALGIDASSMGCPVEAAMDVVELPQDACPVPVWTSAVAQACDGVVVVNRIKPHTDYHGLYESGLMKMIAIGLGKRRQPELVHSHGAPGLREIMPQVARQVLAHGKVLCGLAIVENAYDRPLRVQAIPAARIPEDEPPLLELARRHMPRLPVDELDVLLIDRMGKDISGVGIDPNITGRMLIRGEPDAESPRVNLIAVHDLTPASHGNACGMGLADLAPQRFADAIDHVKTRTNIATSGFLLRGKLPMIAEDDRRVWDLALRGALVRDPQQVRALRIRDTLHCDELWASPALRAELEARPGVELLGEAGPLHDDTGALRPFDEATT